MNTSIRIARLLIRASQYTPFRGRGGYSSAAFANRGIQSSFPQAEVEAKRCGDFFGFFGDQRIRSHLMGRDVLDFGSGYGGRTVEYARSYGARRVWGIEPFPNVVAASTNYARSQGASNVEFRVCGHFEIPLSSESVDTVVSYDVLEHVLDPRRSVGEMHRVLRPGGMAYLVFPVYSGAFSHHLDYITLLPGLHWIFSADTLVEAVNSILAENDVSRFGTQPQPRPSSSFNGQRTVLPGLNGLDGEHLATLFDAFRIVRVHRHGLLRRMQTRSRTMAMISSLAPLSIQDPLTSSVSCVLQKNA
jgi:SAM-dependent methyltransferase